MVQAASPFEGRQGRHPNDCLCLKHMEKRGVQPVPQPIAPVEDSPMALDPDVLTALASNPKALASYIQSQTAAPAPLPISEAPVAPIVATIVPSPSITIPLTPPIVKANGFSTATDGRGKSATFDLNADDVRITKLYLNPKWLAGRTRVTLTVTAE